VIVVGAVALAIGLISVDATGEPHVDGRWSLLFGASAAGSRGLLTAVASSMITVAGVVFSITIVALSLTSSQYTSRVLRNFMRDRSNQTVLGVFVGIFAYCLVVLRTIRGGDEGTFVPSLAVLAGLALAFVGIAFLIFFIHHVSVSIQAASIIATAAEETIAAVKAIFPQALRPGADEEAPGSPAMVPAGVGWSAVDSRETGYIASIDEEALLIVAREHGTIVRMERGTGEFVVEGALLASVIGRAEVDDGIATDLRASYVVSRHRTVEQDVGFGIRQLVDVAMKALSPGVNDTTTAVMCVDHLSAILTRLADRHIPSLYRVDEGQLRVIARRPAFEDLLAEAFDQIRRNAEGNLAVLKRQLEALETIARQTSSPTRRRALKQQASLTAEVARRTVASPRDGEAIAIALTCLQEALGTRPDARSPARDGDQDAREARSEHQDR
jgi:uncharacterized membrane protein